MRRTLRSLPLLATVFAMSFMDTVNLDSSPSSFAFVRDAVTRYGRGW